MKNLEDYTPCELAALSTVIGIIVASKFNVDQQNVIANILFGVAQSIFIIAAQTTNLKDVAESQSDPGKSNANANNDMQKQIDELKEYFKRFEGEKSY
jgi:hypothetical protein